MASSEPHRHHYVPQFFLRNFAVDAEKKLVTTVAKYGIRAIWQERSIASIGYEHDFYVHTERGVPVSVETSINRHIETPISASKTWRKISCGQSEMLDRSDRPILYALVRHLEVRTPHFQATIKELAAMAADPKSAILFTEEEREEFAFYRTNPEIAKTMHNVRASSLAWTQDNFNSSLISVFRSPIPMRTSVTPVLALKVPAHPAISTPLPGMTPYQLILTVNPNTMVSIVLGNFEGAFSNQMIDLQTALGFNRHFVGQFARFKHVSHLVTGRDRLIEDMTWAPFDLVREADQQITFLRRST